MNALSQYRSAVSNRLVAALKESMPFIDDPAIAARAEEFLRPGFELIGGGKRTRAILVAAGWQSVTGIVNAAELPVHAGAAVEFYQASALVHDDIIDEAATRRGKPASHVSFAQQHSDQGFIGSAPSFGEKAAILLGDFFLSLAGLEIEQAEHTSAQALAQGRQIFHSMTAEVAFGQFMDMRAEFTPLPSDNAAIEGAIADSLGVLRHKSARYSVEVPLLLGAALAGADSAMLDSLRAVGRPLGEAFQLRDDELGVFGDPDVTGKPAGDDLIEGKRTVLIGLARRASADARAIIDPRLGKELTEADVAAIRTVITDSGAFAEHERLISEREAQAVAALHDVGNPPLLAELMQELTDRVK